MKPESDSHPAQLGSYILEELGQHCPTIYLLKIKVENFG